MEESDSKSDEVELQELRDIGFTEFQAEHILFFKKENAAKALVARSRDE